MNKCTRNCQTLDQCDKSCLAATVHSQTLKRVAEPPPAWLHAVPTGAVPRLSGGASAELERKPSNPKDQAGSERLPLHLVPSTLQVYAAMAFAEGAAKYGAYNWRATGVRASIYYSALQRHLAKWWNGEVLDPVTKVPHLASAVACLAVLIDAGETSDKLTDDRPPRLPGVARLIDTDARAVVAQVRELAKQDGLKPHDWTIKDAT
jgi:hypothetical protein